MLHDDVVAWMQQVRKAVQSVSEHNGSEYNSLLQQIRTKVCWEQSYCAWGPVKALDWWSEYNSLLLERSAVAYVKAWAREEGEVMGVVDSLHTNSREIW